MITGVKVDCYCAAYLHNFQKNVNSFIFFFSYPMNDVSLD